MLIALQRLGIETIAVDRYDNALGQQVAHHARTITMSDPQQLKALIEAEASMSKPPMLVLPEIGAIATGLLEELEAAGIVRVIPTARAARLTMDRESIRRLAAETLALPTSPRVFADSLEELQAAIDAKIGNPCIVKPVMSSSGEGQSRLDGPADVKKGVGLRDGRRARQPHDTGLVTLITQWQNEFELHARAILALPVDAALKSPGASAAIYGGVDAKGLVFDGVDAALRVPNTDLRLFGKSESFTKRRTGVALAFDADVEVARARAKESAACVKPRAACEPHHRLQRACNPSVWFAR